MRPPDEMIPLLRYSHRYEAHIGIEDTAGATRAGDYPFSGGMIKEDRTGNIRRSVELTIPLWEYENNQLDTVDTILNASVVVGTGDFGKRIQLGKFRVDEIRRVNRGAMQVIGSSFESYAVDARFPLPDYSKQGAKIKDEIERLIRDALPAAMQGRGILQAAPVHSGPTALKTLGDGTVDYATHWERDRWGAIKTMADSQGLEIYTDRNGNFVVGYQANLLGVTNEANPRNWPPAWDFQPGQDGTFIQLETTHSRAGVFNGVLAAYRPTDEGQGGPGARPLYWYLKVIEPTTPPSRLEWGGPFGKKVKFYESSMLGTTAKCQAAAEVELTNCILPDRQYTMTGVGNPYLEAGDVVRVNLLDDGGSELFLVDSVSIPLGVGEGWSITLYSVEKKDYKDD